MVDYHPYDRHFETEPFLNDWFKNCYHTDCCSSGFTKVISWVILRGKRNYKQACLEHDFGYRYGWKYGIKRKQVDKEFFAHIKASGHPLIGWAMYLAVRPGGYFTWRASWSREKRSRLELKEFKQRLWDENYKGTI
ncbi:MAG: hypothetical protein GY861_02760 [bacterium]|nr:hypothetical protein [bacterium]